MEPALDPLAVPEHIHQPDASGAASLAMALAAIDPEFDGPKLADNLGNLGQPHAGSLALAALRRGFHVLLHGELKRGTGTQQAVDAGLLHHVDPPQTRHVRSALEAGHPFLLAVIREPEDTPEPPEVHWVCLITTDGDTYTLHDPKTPEGPETISTDDLETLLTSGDTNIGIEIAPRTRADNA